MAFRLDYSHPSRRVPFGGEVGDTDIIYLGINWSTAAYIMAFAATEGGSPLFTLTNATAGTQGISASYNAGYLHPDTGGTVGATTITPFISEATLEALSYSSDPDAPLVLYFDLLVTPSGGQQRVLCKGTLSIYQGVGD